MEPATLAIEHLMLRLRPLNRALRAAVERQQRAAERFARPGLSALCVTNEQVAALLEDVDELALPKKNAPTISSLLLDSHELERQFQLRTQAETIGIKLPLDVLSESLVLLPVEETALLVCVAPEIERAYGRIYGYVLDDLNRQQPCIELICALATESTQQSLVLRRALGRFGRLRRTGILQPLGEAAFEAKQELRLAPAMLDFLFGSPCDPTSAFVDRAEVISPPGFDETFVPQEIDPALIERSGQALRDGRLGALGIWGSRHCGQSEIAIAIARAAGLPLRRLLFTETLPKGITHDDHISESLQAASALNAILWLDTHPLTEPGSEPLRLLSTVLASHLATSRVPILLTGINPWRPAAVLEARPYAEFDLNTPTFVQRQTMWKHALPEVDKAQRDDLAARFRVQNSDLRAIAQVTRAQAWLAGNGQSAALSDHLETACSAVARKNSYHFATVVKPRRGPADLILPAALHQQVMEIAQFFRAWPRVADEWGFAHMVTGEGGIKALFTGDSGTGKTLAAEVIAAVLKMPLLKIDLSRVVSKWVGETEKHLELAFCEAEDCQAVLFFDEADALFGKRGEVQHGVDRYANMEVSYLLQRLEAYYGLVILASNLSNNLDSAFTRRFQIVVQFPRPEPNERRRIWELALPKIAPLEEGIDFDVLAKLNLTGAGIVGAAQTAALLAMESGNGHTEKTGAVISKWHLVHGIARQYRREARLLTSSELGPYAPLLQESK